MKKKLVIGMLLAVTCLGVVGCDNDIESQRTIAKQEKQKTQTKDEKKEENKPTVGTPSTLEIMQYGIDDEVTTKDNIIITVKGIELVQDTSVNQDLAMYLLKYTATSPKDTFKLSKDDFTLSYADRKTANITGGTEFEAPGIMIANGEIQFTVPKDTKTVSLSYKNDGSAIWNLELPDLSTVSTA